MRILVLLFLTTLISACSNSKSDSWHEAVESGSADVVVYYVPAPGFAEPGPASSENPTGVTADLMRAFAEWSHREMDVEVRLRFVREDDWQAFYSRVRESQGGVFGIGNVTITEERRREIAFSPPYMPNTAVLITSDVYPELATWEDLSTSLEGLSALAFAGTLHEARLRDIIRNHHPAASLEHATSNTEILQRVEDGGYFAYVDGYNVWRAQEQGAAIRHHAIGDDASEHLGVIMPLESDWQPVMTTFMETFYGSPAHFYLFERHLGPRVAALILSGDQMLR
jgi:ABC-type amino acid transport substrate-binding protein